MINRDTPIVGFVARSGTGKTTLIERVIPILKAQGYKLAVIKHDAHRFDMDHPGKDTWRIAQAGADIVAISSKEKVAVIEKVEEEKSLSQIIAMFSKVDIILTEGFKRTSIPKIEVFRSEVGQDLLSASEDLLAIASDVPWNVGVPCYHIDDAEGVAAEIASYFHRFAAQQESP